MDAKERKKFCMDCKNYISDNKKCGICGCHLIFKWSIPMFHCPEGHW